MDLDFPSCFGKAKPHLIAGAPISQSVECWHTDLAVLGSSPAISGNLFNSEGGSIAQRLSLSPSHHPDMTEILLKRTQVVHSILYHIWGHFGGGKHPMLHLSKYSNAMYDEAV